MFSVSRSSLSGSGAALAVAADFRLGIALAQRGEDRLLDRRWRASPRALGGRIQIGLEAVAVHVATVARERREMRADRLLLRAALRFFGFSALASLRFFDTASPAKADCSSSLSDALLRRLEIEAQGPFDGHLEEAELAVLEDAADDALLRSLPSIGTVLRLAVSEVAVDLGQPGDVGFAQLVALVVEALLHLLEEARAVDQLHLASPLLRLAVGDEPDVGEDAGVVEKLVRQGDDGVEPVVLDDPAPDIGRAGPGIAAEQGRAIEDDGDLGALAALLRRVLHLRDHVLKEQQRAIIDRRQPRAETAGEAQLLVLLFDDLLLILPLHAERRVGEHVVELLAGEAVAGLAVAERVAKDDWSVSSSLMSMSEQQIAQAFVVVLLPIEAEIAP